jgi:hypothetical protein
VSFLTMREGRGEGVYEGKIGYGGGGTEEQ